MNINLIFYPALPGTKFPGQFPILIKPFGFPMWAGNTLVTPYSMCWWFPWNWLVWIFIGTFAFLKSPIKLVKKFIELNKNK